MGAVPKRGRRHLSLEPTKSDKRLREHNKFHRLKFVMKHLKYPKKLDLDYVLFVDQKSVFTGLG